MSLELIDIVLPLTLLGICVLVGEILVQARREKAAARSLSTVAAPHERPRVRRGSRAKYNL